MTARLWVRGVQCCSDRCDQRSYHSYIRLRSNMKTIKSHVPNGSGVYRYHYLLFTSRSTMISQSLKLHCWHANFSHLFVSPVFTAAHPVTSGPTVRRRYSLVFSAPAYTAMARCWTAEVTWQSHSFYTSINFDVWERRIVAATWRGDTAG